jgi:hypothetical protein
MGSRQLKRMANRMIKRTGISGEEGVTVSFGFKSLISALLLNAMDELPFGIGLLGTIFFFHWHRIVLVTDQHTYVYKSKMFHRPGDMIGQYPHGPGAFTRKRGKLTFPDGEIVWHSPFFAFRVKRVAHAAGVE